MGLTSSTSTAHDAPRAAPRDDEEESYVPAAASDIADDLLDPSLVRPGLTSATLERLNEHARQQLAAAGREILSRRTEANPFVLDCPYRSRIKRLVDIVGATVILIALAPLMLAVAIAIKISSKGPVFYVQSRLGRQGRWFPLIKFRTMHRDARQRLREVLKGDAELRRRYAEYHKLDPDPRVTAVGRLLRKYSLDELPQLFNVLLGQMSLVGPRAYLPWEALDIRDLEKVVLILQMRPGLTGFWQVGGRNSVSFDERVDMDAFYVANWSLGFDFYVLINTLRAFLWPFGPGESG